MFGLIQVRYKEKYEKEKGKAMLDFETPTYVTAKEAQHMQSQVNLFEPQTFFPLSLSLISLVEYVDASHCQLLAFR